MGGGERDEDRAARAAVLGGYHVIRKEAELSYRTSSSVRLWWELEEPKGPNKAGGLRRTTFVLQLAATPPCERRSRVLLEVELESIRKMLVGAADTGYSMWHNA